MIIVYFFWAENSPSHVSLAKKKRKKKNLYPTVVPTGYDLRVRVGYAYNIIGFCATS